MQAVSVLRPRIIVLENVRGHLTLGFKEVLQRLTEAGYDAKWRVVRASDAGAPHRRERLFIVAQPCNTNSFGSEFRGQDAKWNQRQPQFEFGKCCKVTTNANGGTCQEPRRTDRNIYGTSSEIVNRSNWDEYGSCSSVVTHTERERLQGRIETGFRYEQSCEIDCYSHNEYKSHNGKMQELRRRFATRCEMRLRRAPHPLDLDNKLNAKFVEYMMGLPAGWVTDLPLSRSQQLKILGNGVVPQQAYLALQLLCDTPNIERDL